MLSSLVADPISIGSKRESVFLEVNLVRRNPFGGFESESGFIVPCPPRAEGQPIFTLVCSESVAPIGRGTAGVSLALKDTPDCNLFFTFHCIYFPPCSTSLSC